MSRSFAPLVVAALLLGAGCAQYRHGGALVDRGDDDETAEGTIAGTLQLPEGGDRIPGRRVEAVSLRSGERYSAVTNVTGGFSIQVPPGDYRLDVELRDGESLLKEPGTVRVNMSDLDADIVLEVGLR